MDVEAKYAELLQAVNYAQRQPLAHTAEGQRIQANLDRLAGLVSTLDGYLRMGGRPPVAWSEGPDAPELDDVRDQAECSRCGTELDTASSTSRQHYIDTGRYLPSARPDRDDDYTAEAIDRDGALSILFDRGQPFERPNVIDPRDLQPLGGTLPGVAGSVLPEDAP